MSLVDIPSFQTLSVPLKTTSLPSGAYVLSLAATPSAYAASSSHPLNTISLFDKAQFSKILDLAGHENSITSLRSVPQVTGNGTGVLLSSGKDGFVKTWDERTGSVSIQSGYLATSFPRYLAELKVEITVYPLSVSALTAGRQRPLLSCDASANGLTVAAGTELQGDDALILYWWVTRILSIRASLLMCLIRDPRFPAAPLRTHAYTHSDDVTAVHFSKDHISLESHHSNSILLSASSDGLLCTTKAEENDEDEAGLHVGNWGCSIAQCGWVQGSSGAPGIWAASDMETFSVWTREVRALPRAKIHDLLTVSKLDLVQDNDIRQPSVHRQDLTWVTDYLISGQNRIHVPSDHDNDLVVFTGSNE